MIPASMPLKVKRLTESSKLPTRKDEDVGFDLYADAVEYEGDRVRIKTGISVALPMGTWGMIADRSSMGLRGFKVHGGVIDNGYRGEIIVILYYHGEGDLANIPPLRPGDKVAQLILLPLAAAHVVAVQELSTTERGSGGFGSTGR